MSLEILNLNRYNEIFIFVITVNIVWNKMAASSSVNFKLATLIDGNITQVLITLLR